MSAMARAIPTYDDLLEEIAWLREQLGVEIEAERVSRVARAWGLTLSQARLLLVLHARHGRLVTYAFASDNIPGLNGRDGSEPGNVISVWVCRIRAKLGRDAILNHWGLGFSAPPATLARIDALLQDLT
jgi:DNA-binding response OmpR family regulator